MSGTQAGSMRLWPVLLAFVFVGAACTAGDSAGVVVGERDATSAPATDSAGRADGQAGTRPPNQTSLPQQSAVAVNSDLSLGECERTGAGYYGLPLQALSSVDEWVDVFDVLDAGSVREGEGVAPDDRLVPGAVVGRRDGVEQRVEVYLGPAMANDIRAWVTAGRPGMARLGVLDGVAGYLIVTEPDGTVQFGGSCGSHSTEALDAYVAEQQRLGRVMSSEKLVEVIVAGGERVVEIERGVAELVERSQASTSWHDADPSVRSLVRGETPDDVLQDLLLVATRLSIPAELRGSGLVVCARTSIGWNGCVSVDASGEGVPIIYNNYAVPGEDMRWYVRVASADPSTAVAVGHSDAAAVSEVINDPNRNSYLTVDFAHPAAVLAAAGGGAPAQPLQLVTSGRMTVDEHNALLQSATSNP